MHMCYAMAVKGLKMFQGSKRLYQGTELIQMHRVKGIESWKQDGE